MKRIYHTWDKWECYPAGFYNEKPNKSDYPDATKEKLEKIYSEFLMDEKKFSAALSRVVAEWKNSCEHYLSNENMNRLAWLGQASACIELKLPSTYRSGFHLLSEEQQKAADLVALNGLNAWLKTQSEAELTYEQAQSKTEANLY